jgi:hypothetical protein
MFFIDGFNLYHSMDNDPSFRKYKWLNLHTLCEQLLFPNEELYHLLGTGQGGDGVRYPR